MSGRPSSSVAIAASPATSTDVTFRVVESTAPGLAFSPATRAMYSPIGTTTSWPSLANSIRASGWNAFRSATLSRFLPPSK